MSNIRDYWIDQIQETKEFVQIASTEDPEIEKLEKEIPSLLEEEFIKTSSELGISRREKLLYIVPRKSDTLEDRRLIVENRWGKKFPITYRKLENILNYMIGNQSYYMKLFANEYALNVDLYITKYNMVSEIRKMLRRLVPANIGILVTQIIKINTEMYVSSILQTYDECILNESIEREVAKKVLTKSLLELYSEQILNSNIDREVKAHVRIATNDNFGMYEEVVLNIGVSENVFGNINMFSAVVEKEKEVIY